MRFEFFPNPPVNRQQYEYGPDRNQLCRFSEGDAFRVFMFEFFATFVYVLIVLTIKNSSIKLRKLNQREIWKARNFAMKKHLKKTK